MPGGVPPSENLIRSLFLSWLKRIELHKTNHWKQIAIYDAIQLSKQNLFYYIPQIVSSAFFFVILILLPSTFHME